MVDGGVAGCSLQTVFQYTQRLRQPIARSSTRWCFSMPRLGQRKRSKSAPPVLQSPVKRASKRKLWTDTQMRAAMDAVLLGGSKINRAALDHGIPPSTLKVRLSSRNSFPRTRARLLTSADSLALMEEKERKKQQEQEEKEKRKKEREDKRKKKGAKRLMERARKTAGGQRGKGKGKGKGKLRARQESLTASSLDNLSTSYLLAAPPTKRRRYQDATQIDVDVCCMCFGEYGDDVLEGIGVEWIACACGRWLHVDCAERRVLDVNGCERFCPYCIV